MLKILCAILEVIVHIVLFVMGLLIFMPVMRKPLLKKLGLDGEDYSFF